MKTCSGSSAPNATGVGLEEMLYTHPLCSVSMEFGSPGTLCLWRKVKHISCRQLLMSPKPSGRDSMTKPKA